MNKSLSTISLIIAIISLVLGFLFSIGLLLYIIALAMAIYDLVKAYKAEKLTPKDFLEVACKEHIGSVITLFLISVAFIIL